ncbi:MAG: hypothetical protein IJC13_05325 [Clostridia bacterium]|nr:hypothetical protein [Clostridia bacterium]
MSQDKVKTKNIEKIKWVVPLSILSLSFILLGGFLPVFFNFSKLTCILKVAFIVCYILGFVLVIALTYFDKNNKEEERNCWKDKVFSTFLYVVYTLSFLMFFNHELWGYKETVYGLLFLVVLFLEIYISLKIILGKKLNLEKTPMVLISTAVLTFLLAAVNHTANNLIPANLLYKISIGITYLVAIALFINSYLFKKRDDNKTINTIIGIVFWGSLILVTFPYYVQWCGLKEDDFQTFVTVYAALIGGGITLAGVAWTIKDSNDKRKADLERIEMERKEDDRRKHRPIMHVYAGPYSGLKTDINVMKWLKNTEQISKEATEKLKVPNKIRSCYFGNTEFSNVYVWGIKLNGNITNFDSIRYIKKDSYFYLDFSDKPIYTEKTIETISLIIEDVLENLYELPLDFAYSKEFEWFTIVGNNPSFYIGKVDKGNIIYE